MPSNSIIVRMLCLTVSMAAASTGPAARQPALPVDGCYFTPGRGGMLILHRREGCEVVVDEAWPQTMFQWTGWIEEDGKLALACDYSEEIREMLGAIPALDPSNMRLVPSSTTPGDWDLVEHRADAYRCVPVLQNDGSTRYEAIVPRQETLGLPLAGFLHRVPEHPWRDYFEWRMTHARAEPPPDAERVRPQELAWAIVQSAPYDPAAHAVWLDAMAFCGDAGGIEKAIVDWGEGMVRHPNPSYGIMLRRAGEEARAWRTDQVGTNAAKVMEFAYGRGAGLENRTAMISDLLRFGTNVPPRRSVFRGELPDFLGYQTICKVMHVESVFDMMRGERDAALRLGLANYRGGQLMEQGGTIIEVLLGVAMRATSCRTLELCLVNACETPQELALFQSGLEQLRDLSHDWTSSEFALLVDVPIWTDGESRDGWAEGVTRARVSNQKYELLRGAGAVAKYRMATGDWPGNASVVNVLFAADPPRDVFADGWLLGGPREGGFVVYGTGPDRVDDGGAIAYDPTNGTVSGGDIFVELPARRPYPFPREGYRPMAGDDVTTAFPGGLPTDIFADTRFRPLTMQPGDATVILSLGPDADESRYRPAGQSWGNPWTSRQPQYDPTNGIVSPGNLYYEEPR